MGNLLQKALQFNYSPVDVLSLHYHAELACLCAGIIGTNVLTSNHWYNASSCQILDFCHIIFNIFLGIIFSIPIFILSEKLCRHYYSTYTQRYLLDAIVADCHITIIIILVLMKIFASIYHASNQYNYSSITHFIDDNDHFFHPSLKSIFSTKIPSALFSILGFTAFYSQYLLHDVFERRIKSVMDSKFTSEIHEIKDLLSDKLDSIDDIVSITMDYSSCITKENWKRRKFFCEGLYQRIIVINLEKGEAPMLFYAICCIMSVFLSLIAIQDNMFTGMHILLYVLFMFPASFCWLWISIFLAYTAFLGTITFVKLTATYGLINGVPQQTAVVIMGNIVISAFKFSWFCFYYPVAYYFHLYEWHTFIGIISFLLINIRVIRHTNLFRTAQRTQVEEIDGIKLHNMIFDSTTDDDFLDVIKHLAKITQHID